MGASTKIDLSNVTGIGYYTNDSFYTTKPADGKYDGAITQSGNGTELIYTSASTNAAPIDVSQSTKGWSITSNYAAAITGSSQADTITSGAAGATVHGGAGDDSLVLNAAFAVVDGGAGKDTVSIADAGTNALVYASSGQDDIVFAADGVTVDGSANSSGITVEGTGGSNASITGGAGADQIWVHGDNAYINGGAGADQIYVTGSSSFVLAADGADNIAVRGSYDTVDAGANTKGISVSFLSYCYAGFENTTGANASIRGGSGNDTMGAFEGADVTIDSGAGNDVFSGIYGDNASIQAGAGNDTVVMIANASASVDGGEGNDSIVAQSGVAYGGAGNDTIIIADGATDATIGGGAGNDVFDLDTLNKVNTTGTVSIYDYTYGEDKIVVSPGTVDDESFASDGSIDSHSFNSGDITAKLMTVGSYYKVTVVDGGTNYNVWYTGTSSVLMDASGETGSVYMESYNNEDVSDTLIGSSKADVLVAGAGDFVYGGAGDDYIGCGTGTPIDTSREVVGLAAAGGKDTVRDFTTGFADGNDAVYLFQDKITSASISYAGKNVTIKDGAAQLTIEGIDTVEAANHAEVLVADNTGTIYKVDVANAANVITLNAGTTADIYVGAKAKGQVDFTAITDDVAVDLGNTGAYGSTSAFYNITTVTGGAGSNTLVGAASTQDSITAGSGNSSLWGGGSAADTLVGGDAADVFFYGSGDGSDVVQNFKSGTGDTADKLYFTSGSANAITSTGGTASITWSDGGRLRMTASTNSTLTAANDAVQLNIGGSDYEAFIGQGSTANTFTYDSGVTFYYGGKKSDTLKFAANSSDDAKIWLDGSQGKVYNGITILDASNTDGSVELAGNSSSNTITGGKGSSSLWGGSGAAADTLTGGSGTDTFYFGKAEGNDVITSGSTDDKVMLYNVSLSDIKSCTVTNGVMKISLNDGSSLSIKNYTSNSVNTFTLGGDNTTWTYDNSAKTWTKA